MWTYYFIHSLYNSEIFLNFFVGANILREAFKSWECTLE